MGKKNIHGVFKLSQNKRRWDCRILTDGVNVTTLTNFNKKEIFKYISTLMSKLKRKEG